MKQDQRLRAVQLQIDYFLKEEQKLWEALQAPGAPSNRDVGEKYLPEGNKRLAMVGDSVLRTVLVEEAYAHSEYRGRTQDRISAVACNSNLADVARRHCIDRYIQPAPGTVAISTGTLADTVEAIFGAVYLDGGLVAARQVMQTLGLLLGNAKE